MSETTKIVKIKDKRKFLVIDEEDNIEYTIKVKTNKKGNIVYELYYSKSDIWHSHVRGQLRIKLTNTGNEILIEITDNSDISNLNYAELEALRILMNLEREISEDAVHKIVEV